MKVPRAQGPVPSANRLVYTSTGRRSVAGPRCTKSCIEPRRSALGTGHWALDNRHWALGPWSPGEHD